MLKKKNQSEDSIWAMWNLACFFEVGKVKKIAIMCCSLIFFRLLTSDKTHLKKIIQYSVLIYRQLKNYFDQKADNIQKWKGEFEAFCCYHLCWNCYLCFVLFIWFVCRLLSEGDGMPTSVLIFLENFLTWPNWQRHCYVDVFLMCAWFWGNGAGAWNPLKTIPSSFLSLYIAFSNSNLWD